MEILLSYLDLSRSAVPTTLSWPAPIGVLSCVLPGNSSCQVISLLPDLSLILGSQVPSLSNCPHRYKRSPVSAVLLAAVGATGIGLFQAQYRILTEQITINFTDPTWFALALQRQTPWPPCLFKTIEDSIS